MPLSELLHMATEEPESSQQETCPIYISRVQDNLVELVWENGQILMRGQSSRGTKSPAIHSLPSHTPRVRDTSLPNDSSLRTGKFGLDSVSPIAPSDELDLGQDEMVPWLSYPMDDGPPKDYFSDLLPDISGVTENGVSIHNGFLPTDRKGGFNQTESNLHNRGNEQMVASSSGARFSCTLPQPHQRQTSDPSLGSGVSGIISNNTRNHADAIYGNAARGQVMENDSMSMNMKKQKATLPARGSNYFNFCHFSKPAAFTGSNAPNRSGLPGSGSSCVERMEHHKGNDSSAVKSVISEQFNSTQKDINYLVPSTVVCSKLDPEPPTSKPPKELLPVSRPAVCQDTSSKNEKPHDIPHATKGVQDGEKTVEPLVTSSSVGSGNSADIASCGLTRNSKRKYCGEGETECQSDDTGTESVGLKKVTARGGSSKRSRAAEVHNLSERRRRDRINEKMRALQELIPNCNKADKASMLDEAIEYLKTLQLQVQIMSMGAGLWHPPMMFPAGMQHLHPTHVPPISPMGVGMGMRMGMGFGMGMMDMNMGSPVFPVPSMQGAHFPSISGSANFPAIPASNLQGFAHPGQGFPYSVPRAPLGPFAGRPPVSSDIDPNTSRMTNQTEAPSTSQPLTSENPVANSNPEVAKNEAGSEMNHTFNLPEATNEVLEQPALVQDNTPATEMGGHVAISSAAPGGSSQEAGSG